MQRRRLLAISSATLMAPLASGLLGACGSSNAAAGDAPIGDEELTRQLRGRLAAQLGDEASAEQILPYILDFALTWLPPVAPIGELDLIIAYGFGNRPNAASGETPTDGSNQTALPDPGPVNEQLADTVMAVYARKPMPVYAQWEIARFLHAKHGLSQAVSIEPIIAADGSITYLSTDGVAAKVLELNGNNPAAMGKVGVVGFRDHIKRCVQTTQGRRMQAFAPAGIDMPGTYDPQSGQAWTRRRDLYLLHDMYAQVATLRGRQIAQAYPGEPI